MFDTCGGAQICCYNVTFLYLTEKILEERNEMKKMIFYCTLILGGIIGFTNWIIATSAGAAKSAAWGGVHGSDWIFVIIFAGMFLCGLIGSLMELKNKN